MHQQKYGITPIRKCTLEQQNILRSKFEEMMPILTENKRGEIYWANIYLNQQFCWQTQEKQRDFKNWIEGLVQKIQGSPQYITSYGFINNPSGSTKYQEFHMDYDHEYKSLFIPLTYLVCENSPQFLSMPLNSMKRKQLTDEPRFGKSEKQVLEREGIDFFVVSQLVCKPFVISKLQAGTIHRGIKNSTNEDRYLFWVGYSANKLKIKHQSKLDNKQN